jgi:hypothetical protein
MLWRVRRMPRAAGLLVWALGAVALHAVVPFELSRLGQRAGRPGRTTPAMRRVGLLTVTGGAALAPLQSPRLATSARAVPSDERSPELIDDVALKLAAVCRWIFTLLGAAPGDTLDDLFPARVRWAGRGPGWRRTCGCWTGKLARS